MMNKLTESIQRAASCSDMAAESGTNVHVGLRDACGTDVRQDTGAEESADEDPRVGAEAHAAAGDNA